ncbi:MAG: hypothetical protein IPG75_07845 [Gemmatimonadetes bacterium]|nr:hypothetical protein [Gemmatimonadota bacterium]
MTAIAPPSEVRLALAGTNVQIGDVHFHDEIVSFRSPTVGAVIGPQWRYDRFLALTGNPASALDRLIADSDTGLGICVLAQTSVSPEALRRRRWGLSDVPGLFLRIRLVMVALDHYEQRPNCFIDKGLYLLLRRHNLFRSFTQAWTTLCAVSARGLLEDHLSSLGNRLKFICQAHDLAMIAALRTPGNSTEADCLYHINSLALLSTGALDDLAWLLHHFYPSSLHLQGITLRQGRRGESKLLRHIAVHNPHLSTLLAEPRLRNSIEGLFAIRDQLHHRDLPQVIGHAVGSGDRMFGLLLIPSTTLGLLRAATSDPIVPFQALPGFADHMMADPVWLADTILASTIHVVNAVLALLPWEPLLATLPLEARSACEASLQARLAHPPPGVAFPGGVLF